MSESRSAGGSRRRPTLGLVAEILGVMGALICVLAIVGVLVGRSAVQDRVDVLAKGAVKALDQAVAVSDEALTALGIGTQNATDIRTSAEALASSPTVGEEAVTALQERLAPLGQRYSELRDRYVVLREKATGFMETVRRLDRLVPGIDLPEGPANLVAGMDEKLGALDQAITDLSARASTRAAASETAAAIAQGAGRLEDGITAATELTQNVQDGLIAVQSDVTGFSDRVNTLVGLSSVALVLVLLWFALLHVALWALGRRWRAPA